MKNSEKKIKECVVANHAVEERVIEALKNGFKVIATIRAFRVTFSPIYFFYIELVAINEHDGHLKEIEIGFWPGMTKKLKEVEVTLKKIKKSHPEVRLIHMEKPPELHSFIL